MSELLKTPGYRPGEAKPFTPPTPIHARPPMTSPPLGPSPRDRYWRIIVDMNVRIGGLAMYKTMWIDVRPGKEQEVLDLVANRIREYKEEYDLNYAEVGMVFEELDIFTIIDVKDEGTLVDFILDEIGPIEGVLEVKLGSINKMSNPIPAIEGEHFHLKQVTVGQTPEYRKVEGYRYYLIFIDAEPVSCRAIYKRLEITRDAQVRFFGFSLENYNTDILLALQVEDPYEARTHAIEKVRSIEGVRDTKIYTIDNVRSL
jgi:DNA-binding Lrp family transcriptional regulator